ncbi:hypothetical protein EV401DRAFT_1865675 [Pisolithus croceorrhizus]|nr:hypothetical protein EV401DRAFT_1865675 [Pisolithus croceorrhizus]
MQSNDMLPPPNIRNLAIDIAHRLSSLRDFLEAAEHLMNRNDLFTDAVINHHGRKLLAIVEVARMTLTRVGLKLHLFTSCSTNHQPFKSAYFKMLVLLRQHREEFPVELLDRVDRLLLPLTTRLFIFHNSDPYAQLGIAESIRNFPAPQAKHTAPALQTPTEQHRHMPPWPTNKISASMPPPDAFPQKPLPHEEKHRRQSKKRTLLSSGHSRPVHRQHPSHPPPGPDPSGDSAGPSTPRIFTRTPRHFGIFCTGKPRPQQHWERTC